MVRGAARAQAILDATVELLGEVGYAALTMDAVAARARASKTTIYRRWPGKPALVRAAMDHLDAEEAAATPDTGTLRGDLLAALRGARDRMDDRYLVRMTGLLHAMRVDPELADALRAHVADEDVGPFRTVTDRAVARGELSAGARTVLAHQVAEGQLLRRTLLGEPLTDDFLTSLVDDLVVPVLTGVFR